MIERLIEVPRKNELAVIGDAHELVLRPVSRHLFAADQSRQVESDALHLDDAACGVLRRDGLLRAALELILGEQTADRHAGTHVLEAHHATHARLEISAHLREQALKCRVIRGFSGGRAGPVYLGQFREAGFQADACRLPIRNLFGSPACLSTAFAVCRERILESTVKRLPVSGLNQIS